MKILNFRTGTSMPVKISGNLSNPLPLLVVHSGKTTTGRSALMRIASRLENSAFSSSTYSPGTWPVAASMESRETRRKPRTFARGVGVREEEDEIAAEPVPVLRPGVTLSGAEDFAALPRSTGAHTGKTKIGSKLDTCWLLVGLKLCTYVPNC